MAESPGRAPRTDFGGGDRESSWPFLVRFRSFIRLSIQNDVKSKVNVSDVFNMCVCGGVIVVPSGVTLFKNNVCMSF